MDKLKLIIGLGNPGPAYTNHRHNVGFRCLSHLAKRYGIPLTKQQSRARIGRGGIAGVPVVLARPQTFMNSSGESVRLLMKRFGIPVEGLLVIHDDLDLPTGKIRIQQGGRSAGHKGIESITDCLGSPDFLRVRVGIGRPEREASRRSYEETVIAYVLSDFTLLEGKIVEEVLPQIADAVHCLFSEGIAAAMNRYN